MKKKKMKVENFSENKKNISSAQFKNIKMLSEEITNIKNVEGFYNTLKKLPNPDEILRKTGKGIEILRQIERDGQVATCITSRQAGVLSLKHRLKFNTTNEKFKDFWENLIKKLAINDIIKAILNAPKYGYQPIEIVWGVSKDGYTIPKRIIAKPPEWFFYNSEDRQLYFKQKGKNNGLLLSEDLKKFLCPRNNATYENPYGESYLSLCFWDTIFKRGSKEFWIKFSERYGMPWLIGKYERGSSDEEIDDLLDALEAMIQDAVAVFPDNSSIEIHDNAGKSATVDVFEGLINVCDKSIAKNILGQTLTTDVSETGSYSLGKVHQQVRSDIINADKELVENQFNILLTWIQELNFGNDDAPEFELYLEEEVDQARAERDTKIHGMGVRFSKEYFIKAYGYADEDIEKIENNINAEFAEEKTENSNDLIEDFINKISDNQLNEIISEKIAPIIKNFSETKDPQKALEDLAVLYPNKDSKNLEETLANAIFVANLWGQVNVEKD